MVSALNLAQCHRLWRCRTDLTAALNPRAIKNNIHFHLTHRPTFSNHAHLCPPLSPVLTGTIPRSMANLTNLRVLDLTANHLTGTVPPRLCSHESDMVNMLLASNRLTGPLELDRCEELVMLDVSVSWRPCGGREDLRFCIWSRQQACC